MRGGEGNIVQTPALRGGGGDVSGVGINVDVAVVVSSPPNTHTSSSILVRDTLHMHLDAVLGHPVCVCECV